MLALVKPAAIVSFPSQVGVVQDHGPHRGATALFQSALESWVASTLANVKFSLDSVVEDGRLAVVAPRMAVKVIVPYLM